MKKLAMLIVLLTSLNTFAGVKGSIGYEIGKTETVKTIPYTVCAPNCQTVSNTYISNQDSSQLRGNLGYEQTILGPISIDLVGSTNLSLYDFRTESNLIVRVTDLLAVKGGINRYQEKSDDLFKYRPGMGFQVGAKLQFPSAGEVKPFLDVTYHRMNTGYDYTGSNSTTDIHKNVVGVNFGFKF